MQIDREGEVKHVWVRQRIEIEIEVHVDRGSQE